jgi:hypothetical protein
MILWSQLTVQDKQSLVLLLQQQRTTLLLTKPSKRATGSRKKVVIPQFKSKELEAFFYSMPEAVRKQMLGK